MAGLAPPAVIGVGFPLLGLVLRLVWRKRPHEPFSERRQEVADPSMLGQADLHPAVDLL